MPEVAQQLLAILGALDAASQFCTSGTLAPVLPGLDVQGVGEVGLPVRPVEARQLIQWAAPAPYGRGEETIVDVNVRRVWQIDPAQCIMHNPAWETCIAGIVDAVRQDFGIDHPVHWDFYKLLIYEQGSFFARHRDSEKVDGMFATLVVCLPSRYQGGTLIVSHDGESKTIDFGGEAGAYSMQYAAFYTDCIHEITPVTSGYRVCLVYNLSLAQRQRQPTAPRHGQQVGQVASLLSQIFADPAREKIAIPLAHEYSEAGLRRHLLKGTDRSCVEVLTRAAARLGYQLYLALMTHHQLGAVDDDSWDYGDRWSAADDDDAEMGEIFEESMTLNYWIDAQGHPKACGEIQLDADDILATTDFDAAPTRQEVHEATGNEGVTMERWYRRGMIVIWPADRYFRILAGEGQASALPALAELLDGQPEASRSDAGRTFAEAIIDLWQLPTSSYASQRASHAADMLQHLERLADAALAQRFIEEILSRDYNGSEGEPLRRLCDRLGWDTLRQALRHFVTAQLPGERTASLTATVSIFRDLCCGAEPMSATRRATCTTLAGVLADVIHQWDNYQEQRPWLRPGDSREGIIASLFHAFGALGEAALLEQFLTHVLRHPEHYELHTVLIPAVQKLRHEIDAASPGRADYRRLLSHCIAALASLTATPVPVPSDWAQNVTLRCNCADCTELQQFLRDPQARQHRFRVRKERRQHLHQQIDAHGCDVDHVTDRRGSPQTLVCTKNRASYERQQQAFADNTRLLAELRDIAAVP